MNIKDFFSYSLEKINIQPIWVDCMYENCKFVLAAEHFCFSRSTFPRAHLCFYYNFFSSAIAVNPCLSSSIHFRFFFPHRFPFLSSVRKCAVTFDVFVDNFYEMAFSIVSFIVTFIFLVDFNGELLLAYFFQFSI